MRKHTLDWFSLLAGLVFVAVAVVHLVAASTTHAYDVRWVFPVAMVLVGLGSLISLVRRDRDDQAVVDQEVAEPDVVEPEAVQPEAARPE